MDIKKGKKMISKKRLVLKNGQQVKLEFYHLPDIFSIYALDKNNEIVGILSFEIMKRFVCVLSEQERQAEAKARNVPLFMVKKQMQIDVFQSSMKMYDIQGDVLLYDGEKYMLEKTSAILDLIEIKDRNFFQVGLGSAMHKEMENFVRETNCDEIRLALYYPFGEFQNGTRAFYEHMGYVFEKTNGTTTVFKPLSKQTSKAESQNSFGTPVQAKYFQKEK